MKKTKNGAHIENECTGLNFKFCNDEDLKGQRVSIALCIEDDEKYHEKDYKLSSYWIDDLIKTLQESKEYMEKNFEKDEWGYYKK